MTEWFLDSPTSWQSSILSIIEALSGYSSTVLRACLTIHRLNSTCYTVCHCKTLIAGRDEWCTFWATTGAYINAMMPPIILLGTVYMFCQLLAHIFTWEVFKTPNLHSADWHVLHASCLLSHRQDIPQSRNTRLCLPETRESVAQTIIPVYGGGPLSSEIR